MNRVVPLGSFELPGLERDHSFVSLRVGLQQCTTDRKIRSVTDDAKGFLLVWQRQYWRALQTGLDFVKGLLMAIIPSPVSVLLQEILKGLCEPREPRVGLT